MLRHISKMTSQVPFGGGECKVRLPALDFGLRGPHRLQNTELAQTLPKCILIEFDFFFSITHVSYQDILRTYFYMLLRAMKHNIV